MSSLDQYDIICILSRLHYLLESWENITAPHFGFKLVLLIQIDRNLDTIYITKYFGFGEKLKQD